MNKLKQGLTSFDIKFLGIILMVLDHIAEFFYFAHIPIWFHWLGRIVAPIFLFTSSEGFIYTRDRKKYLFRLLAGFWLMGIGNTIFNHYFTTGDTVIMNNIFGTIFLGVLYMQAIEWIKGGFKGEKTMLRGIILALLPVLATLAMGYIMTLDLSVDMNRYLVLGFMTFIPTLITIEGGILLVVLAVLFYVFHGKKWAQVLSLIAMSILTLAISPVDIFLVNYQWMMFLAAIPLVLYNGQKGRGMRNFFYFFYPAHIYFLALLAFFIQK
jgi:hypothetical protein